VTAARSLYGLGVESNVPIAAFAGLEPCARRDVRWTLGALPDLGAAEESWEEYRRVEESCVRASRLPGGSHYRLAYDDGTECVIDARGEEVWAKAPAGATIEDTATYLLGPVMGFVLRLRGVTCLHASAVAVDGRAIALAGHAGAGKSSAAAAFARAGHAVLTDDVTALTLDAGRYCVEPAYPRIRLWPESVASMFGSPDGLPRITPTWDKRFLGLDGAFRFQRERLPLAAIYVLEDRAPGRPRIEPLEPSEALIWLVAHAYSAQLLDKRMRAREFECLARLVEQVPVARVAPSDDYGRLAQLCETLAGARAHASV
jgi:hypothetical protein